MTLTETRDRVDGGVRSTALTATGATSPTALTLADS